MPVHQIVGRDMNGLIEFRLFQRLVSPSLGGCSAGRTHRWEDSALGGRIVGRTQRWEDAECGNRGGDDLSKTRTQPLVVGNK